MGIFSKKITLDEILKALDGLTPEEKQKIHEKTADLYKAEDEREIDKIEEEKADTAADADEKAEEVSEESEEIGKDVDEIKDEAAEDGDPLAEEAEEDEDEESEEEGDDDAEEEIPEAQPEEMPDEQPEVVEPPLDPGEEANVAEIVKSLTEKVNAMEHTLAELTELKAEYEKYVEKQKGNFGYKSGAHGSKKDYADMSADELKNEILKG